MPDQLQVRARRKLRRAALHVPNRLTLARNLPELESAKDERVQAVARATRATARKALAPSERSAVAAVERIRAELLSSDARLEARASEWTGREDRADEIFVETVAGACRRSRPPLWGLFLFQLVRELRPSVVVELGTCVGISAAYLAAALDLNEHGRLVTIEAIGSRAAVAEDVFARLGLRRVEVRRGRFEDVLPTLAAELPPVDLAFVDGNHFEEPTVAYFHAMLPSLAPDAALVFDDIAYSDGMEQAWDRICSDERVAAAVDLGPVGICLLGRNGERKAVSLPLEPKPEKLRNARPS